MKNLIIFIILLAFQSCSTVMSKEECQSHNWELVGKNDGQSGLDQSSVLNRFQAECGKEYGMKVDVDLYNKGYFEGLKTFCSYENAVSDAKFAKSKRNKCIENSIYLAGYQAGFKIMCTYEGAKDIGRLGMNLDVESTCPKMKQDQVARGYVLGMTEHLQKKNMDLDFQARELETKKENLNQLESRLSRRANCLNDLFNRFYDKNTHINISEIDMRSNLSSCNY